MGRIISFPTRTPTENDYFVMDHLDEGTHSVSTKELALAMLPFTTDGYRIKIVDVLPPAADREPKVLYFLRKEQT